MAIFSSSCYVAPGGALVELSGGSYARQALSLTGTFQAGATQALAAFGAAAGPTTATTAATPTQIRAGAIFDAVSGGNQLCYWGWPLPWSYTLITVAFPAVTLNVRLIGTIAASFNTFSGLITRGEELGRMNGNPLITSTDLSILGGLLTASPHPMSAAATLGITPSAPTYNNDAAAAAGGVPVGSMYRNGSLLMMRLT